jgi:hypothetical protein
VRPAWWCEAPRTRFMSFGQSRRPQGAGDPKLGNLVQPQTRLLVLAPEDRIDGDPLAIVRFEADAELALELLAPVADACR